MFCQGCGCVITQHSGLNKALSVTACSSVVLHVRKLLLQPESTRENRHHYAVWQHLSVKKRHHDMMGLTKMLSSEVFSCLVQSESNTKLVLHNECVALYVTVNVPSLNGSVLICDALRDDCRAQPLELSNKSYPLILKSFGTVEHGAGPGGVISPGEPYWTVCAWRTKKMNYCTLRGIIL